MFNEFRAAGVLPRRTDVRRSRLTGTGNFRRRVYQRDLWVRPLDDTGHYRETTPEFFQLNPAMAHRLVPWLNRELVVLLANHENRLSFVLELILRLIEQHHIRSRHFRDALVQYMGANTEHFIHEFYQFARCPYDMYGFDENADYQPRSQRIQHEEVAVSESSEDEEQEPIRTRSSSLLLPTRDIPLPPSPQPGPSGLSSGRAFSDDGQSYTARPSGAAAVDPSDDEDGVEILQEVRPSPPEVITLSSTEEDDEEEESPTASASSRGKALKKRRNNPHKEKRLKAKKKAKKSSKRERSPTPEQPARYRKQNEIAFQLINIFFIISGIETTTMMITRRAGPSITAKCVTGKWIRMKFSSFAEADPTRTRDRVAEVGADPSATTPRHRGSTNQKAGDSFGKPSRVQ